jgi:hypothetical protein
MFENTDFLLSYSRADAIWDAVLVDFLPRRHFGLPLPSCFDQASSHDATALRKLVCG